MGVGPARVAGGNLLGAEEQARWEHKGKKTEAGWRDGRQYGENDREGKDVGENVRIGRQKEREAVPLRGEGKHNSQGRVKRR